MNRFASLLPAMLLVASSHALADCSKPGAPELPDGATSDLQTMVDGQRSVKEYVASTEAYLECLANQETADMSEGEIDPEAMQARVDQHNAAVAEMEAVAAEFNEEIREYKAKAK